MPFVTFPSTTSDSSQGDLKDKPISLTDSRDDSLFQHGDVKSRAWRKVDLHIMPWISLLYLFCFMDRVNIGNAKIAGMVTDLHLTGLRYNTAAAIFFVTFCVVEVPSNVVLKLFRPSRWVPTLMVAWGVILTLMSFVKTYQGLVVARLFLGLAEGGLFPGLIYYISLWYPRQMHAKRIAMLPAAGCITGAFGGLLAYGIVHLNGKAGLHGWQWIFLLEGLVTIVIAFASYFIMHDYPDTATFLTEDEWRVVIDALREDYKGQATHFSMQFIWQALADWKTYAKSIIYIGILIPIYAIALFMPTIIHNLGFSAVRAQLMSVPPFISGGILTIVFGIYSDRLHLRGPFVVLGATISMVGFILLYTMSKPWPGYAAAIIAASGVCPANAIALAWAAGNAGGDLKRGVVIAVVIGIGNVGGVFASYIYYQPPRFHVGHGTAIGCLAMSIIASCLMMWKYKTFNMEKDKMCLREGIDYNMQDKFTELGDRSPLFRYVI